MKMTKESIKAKDMLNSEIINNERKQSDIEKLQDIIKKKDEEILRNNGDAQKEQEMKKIKDELNRAKDMFLEYEHTIANITKEKDEELKKLKIAKKKVEEDYRNAVKEKQLLKDTERILLNTFDTLKKFYDEKDGNEHNNSERNNRNSNPEGADTEQDSGSKFTCDKCRFETRDEGILKNHAETHIKSTRRTRIYTKEEQRVNGFCLYWNRGFCHNEELCAFLHEESPYCYYQERCNKQERCRFFHEAFLEQAHSPIRIIKDKTEI